MYKRAYTICYIYMISHGLNLQITILYFLQRLQQSIRNAISSKNQVAIQVLNNYCHTYYIQGG